MEIPQLNDHEREVAKLEVKAMQARMAKDPLKALYVLTKLMKADVILQKESEELGRPLEFEEIIALGKKYPDDFPSEEFVKEKIMALKARARHGFS